MALNNLLEDVKTVFSEARAYYHRATDLFRDTPVGSSFDEEPVNYITARPLVNDNYTITIRPLVGK